MQIEVTVRPEHGQDAAWVEDSIEELQLDRENGLTIYFDNGNCANYSFEDFDILAFSKNGEPATEENGFSGSNSKITIANTLTRHHDDEGNYIGRPEKCRSLSEQNDNEEVEEQ